MEDSKDIKNIAMDYFSSLFMESNHSHGPISSHTCFKQFSAEKMGELDILPTVHELKSALFLWEV